MENRKEPAPHRQITDRELDKMIAAFLEMDKMDDRPLYYKIKARIAAIEVARRRKRVRTVAVATSAAAVLVAALVWSLSTVRQIDAVDAAPAVDAIRLTVSNGRDYILSDTTAHDNLYADGSVVMKAEEGTLFIEASGDEAPPEAEPAYNTLEVPRAMQYDMVMSDGTKVWLNSDTRLRFPTVFTGSERRVYLEGEAYFEVARVAGKPFIIEMGDQGVEVLGTSFNVNAYRNNPTKHTTLFTGSLRVTSSVTGQKITLTPGQQASLDTRTGEMEVRQVNLSDILAWRVNVINLEKRTLEEVASYMSKIYNIEFRFADERARGIRFRGNVSRSDDLHRVLDRLGEVGGVNFVSNGNEIEIHMK